jgi:hypothetical protein
MSRVKTSLLLKLFLYTALLKAFYCWGSFHLMAWPVFLCINGKISSMFLKYLAKMDLILILSKFSSQL